MHHEVCTDKDGAVALSWRRRGACASRLGPSHDFKIENEYVVVEILSVPATEDEHLGATNEVGSVIKPGSRCTAALWALVPCHGHRVKSMQVAVHNSLGAFAAEYDNARPS